LRLLALLTTAVNFLQAPLSLAIIVLAQQTLRLNVQTIGLIFSVGGAAGLLASLVAPWVYTRVRFKPIVAGGIALWALATVLLALAPGAPLLAAGQGLIDLVWPFYAVAVVTYRLSVIPDHLQGRINSSFRLLTYGVEPLGTALGGVLLAVLGPRPVLWLAAAGLFLAFIFAAGSDLRQA
jgi:predicted MFS family arabinose efflux permease